MNPDVISVPPEMDQEDVARLFEHYNMLALPVVDPMHKIIGIVTVDDVVSVLKREQAEDIQKLGAVAPIEQPYLQTEFWTFVQEARRLADRDLHGRDPHRQRAGALRARARGHSPPSRSSCR